VINWKRSGPDVVASSPRRHSWSAMPEDLPVDILPASNEEYLPPPPSREQIGIMRLADEETERWRRRFNMSRAEFVRTTAAMTIGFWAIDVIRPGIFGNYGALAHNTKTTNACDLEWAGRHGLETLRNLPGEFIFDVQSHHVDPHGMWRVTNPAIEAFFAGVWPQASPATGGKPGIGPGGYVRGGGAGEIDPIENLSRFHYLKELYLDSATTATVLSVVPTSPDTNNPLPIKEAVETIETVNHLARSKRSVMHAFVMPNRGSTGTINPGPHPKPLYFDEEMDLMMERAHLYHDKLRGWKTYCAWGDVPYASGWFLDSDVGMQFLHQVKKVSEKYPQIPPVVATHKGFALPGFDQRAATPRDIGPAAKANPHIRFLVYHSGYDIGDTQRAYRGDAKAKSNTNTVDGLIKSLRENHYDAPRFRKKGHHFGNVPNVWAELGSVWRSVMDDPDQAAHLLGKLITHVGPKRIAWGTDSLWYGSPQKEIVALRRFDFTERGRELYNLPHGLEGDVENPMRKARHPSKTIRNAILGRNAAHAYNFDPDRRVHEIHCDAVQKLRDEGYLQRQGTLTESAPLRMNQIPGPRTRREVLKGLTENPWSP
jgi:predicted TIM-barrel fold metal-dependent hydrolase